MTKTGKVVREILRLQSEEEVAKYKELRMRLPRGTRQRIASKVGTTSAYVWIVATAMGIPKDHPSRFQSRGSLMQYPPSIKRADCLLGSPWQPSQNG
jgi:hypothetical protein